MTDPAGSESASVPGRARALLGFVAFGLFWGTWGASLPAIERHAGADSGSLGVALLFIAAGALLSMRGAGALLDRAGRRGLPLTLLVFAAAALLPPVAGSPLALGGLLAVLGAGSGALDVAINAEATRYEANAAPVLNLAHALFSAAVVAGSLLTGAIHSVSGSPTLPFALAAALIGAAAVAATRLPAAPFGAVASVRRGRLRQVPRPLLLLGALCALAYFVENAWQNWSAVLLRGTLHAGLGQAALGPALFAAAAVAGRLLGQTVATRLSARALLAAGAAIAAAGSALAASASLLPLALIGISVAGLGTSVCAPSILSLAGRLAAPGRRASAISIVTTLGYSGFLLGPALVGLAADGLSLRAALVGVAVVALVLAVLASRAPE